MQIDAITYVVSVITLALVHYQGRVRTTSSHQMTWRRYLHEVDEGWHVVRTNTAVGLGLIALAGGWIGGGFLHVAGNVPLQTAASIKGMERVGFLMLALRLGDGV